MRLSCGVTKDGFAVVVDDDRNPHKEISGKLTHFQALVFISRLKRRFKKASKR